MVVVLLQHCKTVRRLRWVCEAHQQQMAEVQDMQSGWSKTIAASAMDSTCLVDLLRSPHRTLTQHQGH